MIKNYALAILLSAGMLVAGSATAEPVFLLAQSQITDAEVFFNQYGPRSYETLTAHGAEIYFAAQDYSELEGEWSGNWTVMVSFPSEESALDWYHSTEYHEDARPLRLSSSADGRLIIFRPVPSAE